MRNWYVHVPVRVAELVKSGTIRFGPVRRPETDIPRGDLIRLHSWPKLSWREKKGPFLCEAIVTGSYRASFSIKERQVIMHRGDGRPQILGDFSASTREAWLVSGGYTSIADLMETCTGSKSRTEWDGLIVEWVPKYICETAPQPTDKPLPKNLRGTEEDRRMVRSWGVIPRGPGGVDTNRHIKFKGVEYPGWEWNDVRKLTPIMMTLEVGDAMAVTAEQARALSAWAHKAHPKQVYMTRPCQPGAAVIYRIE